MVNNIVVLSFSEEEVSTLCRNLSAAAQGYSDAFYPNGQNVDARLLAALEAAKEERTPRIVAVLSSTVLTDGVYSCEIVPFPSSLTGIPHYVGHPATKGLIEALGAVSASTKLFAGLAVGESYIAVPLARNERVEGWTKDTAVTDVSQLQAKLVTRLA